MIEKLDKRMAFPPSDIVTKINELVELANLVDEMCQDALDYTAEVDSLFMEHVANLVERMGIIEEFMDDFREISPIGMVKRIENLEKLCKEIQGYSPKQEEVPISSEKTTDWEGVRIALMSKLEQDIKKYEASLEPRRQEKTTGLTFEEAMKFLRQGKRIRHSSWKGTAAPFWICRQEMGTYLNTGTILNSDWEVVDD
jgi:hypothetical protein